MRLDECGEVVGGATPKTSTPAYWDGPIMWVTPKELSGLDGPHISTTERTISEEGLKSCASRVLPPGSVLLSSRAPIGHTAINTAPMATNQGFKSIIPKPGRLDAKYLLHWLRKNRPRLEAMGNGATFKELSKKRVSEIAIPLPPLEEQRRIADVLDRADALRAKRRAAIEQLETLKQSIFLDMFGDPRTNPRDLRKEPLGSLVRLKSGEALPASKMNAGNVPVFGGNGISGYHDQYLFDDEQIVIVRVGAYCGVIHVSPAKAWITDNALYVSERSEELEFVYLAHSLATADLNQYSSQFGQPLVSGSRIYPVEILVPPLNAQGEFAARLEALSSIGVGEDKSLRIYSELLVSLQQRAFRGEL